MLEEVCELTGQGKGTLVSELMTGAMPGLRAAAEALLVVKQAPRDAQAVLARFSNEATIKLAQAQLEFDDVAPPARRQKRKRGNNAPS